MVVRLRALLAGMVALGALLHLSAEERKLPLQDLSGWRIEQQPGGRVAVADGVLTIDDAAGGTVWWHEQLTAPVEISYTVTVVSAGGPNDRVSDLNCFWMATDPRHPENLFAPGHGRTGQFETYDGLRTYYVGYGGHANTKTRFRRYSGGGDKPLRPEHDLDDSRFLIQPNHAYRIRLVARPDGTVEYYRDGERVFAFHDPAPLRTGWFGFRTVQNRMRISDVVVRTGASASE